LGHHEKLQAKDGGHYSHDSHAAGQAYAHRQPRDAGLTQVSEAMWLTLIGDGAEVPKPKETVIIQEPVPIADGD
jgi:hypothetical protein